MIISLQIKRHYILPMDIIWMKPNNSFYEKLDTLAQNQIWIFITMLHCQAIVLPFSSEGSVPYRLNFNDTELSNTAGTAGYFGNFHGCKNCLDHFSLFSFDKYSTNL